MVEVRSDTCPRPQPNCRVNSGTKTPTVFATVPKVVSRITNKLAATHHDLGTFTIFVFASARDDALPSPPVLSRQARWQLHGTTMPGVLAHRKHVFGVPVLQILEHGVGISDGAVSTNAVGDPTDVPLSKGVTFSKC